MESVASALLPLPEGLVLESVQATPTTVFARIACIDLQAACPHCHQPSQRIHGHYTRTVADLPCAGRRVVLYLSVRKFVCGTPTCPQRIFTERLPEFVTS
jgi:transposase